MSDLPTLNEKKPVHHRPKHAPGDTKIATATTKIITPGRPPVTVKNDVIVSADAVQGIVERGVKSVTTLAAVPFFGALKAIFILTCILFGLTCYQSRDMIISEIVKSVNRTNVLEHRDSLANYVRNHKVIAPVVKTLRQESQASRVVFFQFHNGTSSLKGVAFLYASQTEVATAPGVSDDRESLQHVPIGMFIDWLPNFLENKCVYDSVETANSSLAELMNEHGVNAAFACPVYVPGAREPSGFIAASYMSKPTISSDQITSELRSASILIGAALAKDSVVEDAK